MRAQALTCAAHDPFERSRERAALAQARSRLAQAMPALAQACSRRFRPIRQRKSTCRTERPGGAEHWLARALAEELANLCHGNATAPPRFGGRPLPPGSAQ